jgi:uncharacterized protein YcbK (DUF882 family)
VIRTRIALLCVFFLAACGGAGGGGHSGRSGDLIGVGMSKTQPDAVAERRIVLAQPESGEHLDLVYFHDGRYDPHAMAKIEHLFRDRRAGVTGPIDPELIDFLVDIRTRLNLPPTVVFQILSGYRTRQSNIILAQHNGNVASESLHMHGWAVDFRIANVDGRAIAAVAKTMERGAAVYYPNSNHVHVDIGNIRTWHER